MLMADFTKGPWKAGETPSRKPAVYAGGPKSTHWTGKLTNRPLCTVDTLEDAHLIAAAPELFEALGALMGGDDKIKVGIGGNPRYVNAFMDRAYAALAKARG